MSSSKRGTFFLIGPGLLLAATGVGTGDLATGSLVGSMLGVAVLWAVVVGAFFKFVVTEGLARWQLATGETLLEGAVSRLGRGVIWCFLPYLLLWSFFVGSALMSAAGVTLHAMLPVFDDAVRGKVVFGILASLIGLAIVWFGGYRAFEGVMRGCIAIMFVTVVLTAVLLWPGTGPVLEGLFIPQIPDASGQGIKWTLALIGGVGGTLTVLCYGYWLREEGLTHREDLRACRIDLATGYIATAIFGLSMVIVGSNISIEGSGATLLVTLSDRLETLLGPFGQWLFVVGTLGAVFSSLLGVWQSIPYLFADCWLLLDKPLGDKADRVDTRSAPYRAYLLLIAIVPMAGLLWRFRDIQLAYAVTGALLFPVLALVLLIFNGCAGWVGPAFRNHPLTVAALIVVLLVFSWMGVRPYFA